MSGPIIVRDFEQGSIDWIKARIGVITMSNAAKLLTGGQGKTRESYIMEVISEVLSGIPSERVSTWDMQRGILLEPFARRAYELTTGAEVEQVALVYLDDRRSIACSPDGLTVIGGVEIKCPAPKNHLRAIIDGKDPKKYAPQVQGGMMVTGKERWDFVSFCPEFKSQPLFIYTAHRDEAMINKIRDACELAAEEVKYCVEEFTKTPPNKALESIIAESLELISVMRGDEMEIE